MSLLHDYIKRPFIILNKNKDHIHKSIFEDRAVLLDYDLIDKFIKELFPNVLSTVILDYASVDFQIHFIAWDDTISFRDLFFSNCVLKLKEHHVKELIGSKYRIGIFKYHSSLLLSIDVFSPNTNKLAECLFNTVTLRLIKPKHF